MKKLSYTYTRLFFLLCACAIAAGCAKPADLSGARTALFEARKANAEKCAPAKFREAEEKINRAESTNDMVDAYVARRAAESALAAALFNCNKQQVDELRTSRDNLLAMKAKLGPEAEAAELEKLKKELEALKTVSAEEEAALRDEIASLKDQLSKTKADTEISRETIAELKRKLAEKEAALKKAESEKEKAKKAMLKAMNKIATTKRSERGLVVYLSDILFDFNKADLKPGAKKKIAEICKLLKKYPYNKIRVEGHTDNLGPKSYNLELSQKRAESVRKEMIANGIPPSKIRAFGYGEERPMVSNSTPEGRQRNRRVEIVIQ